MEVAAFIVYWYHLIKHTEMPCDRFPMHIRAFNYRARTSIEHNNIVGCPVSGGPCCLFGMRIPLDESTCQEDLALIRLDKPVPDVAVTPNSANSSFLVPPSALPRDSPGSEGHLPNNPLISCSAPAATGATLGAEVPVRDHLSLPLRFEDGCSSLSFCDPEAPNNWEALVIDALGFLP